MQVLQCAYKIHRHVQSAQTSSIKTVHYKYSIVYTKYNKYSKFVSMWQKKKILLSDYYNPVFLNPAVDSGAEQLILSRKEMS